MAEQDSTAEKTEEPTAKRLEKAREDGQVVRSPRAVCGHDDDRCRWLYVYFWRRTDLATQRSFCRWIYFRSQRYLLR